jgi:predicted Holliday junction resolvase-like endonuclease
MGIQVQELKKQRKLLIFACCVFALMVFVAGIYAVVQSGIAVENEKKAIEAMWQTMECEKEAMRQKELAEKAMDEAQRATQQAREEFLRKSSGSPEKDKK